jgi:hypothetical protein
MTWKNRIADLDANYSGLLRAIFAGAAVAAVVALLAGCDLGTGDHVPDFSGQYNYTACTNYTVTAQDRQFAEVVDSTATCPDNSAPFMIEAQWLSTDSSCSVVPYTNVIGGLAGIRRTFGCWRPAPKYTGPPL